MKPSTASCMDTTIFWPSPVRSRACSAARMPTVMLTPAASSPMPRDLVPLAPAYSQAVWVQPVMLLLVAAVLP